jgi:hypothetical protein
VTEFVPLGSAEVEKVAIDEIPDCVMPAPTSEAGPSWVLASEKTIDPVGKFALRAPANAELVRVAVNETEPPVGALDGDAVRLRRVWAGVMVNATAEEVLGLKLASP